MTFTPKFTGPPKTKISALLEKAKLEEKALLKEKEETWLPPEEMLERIRIIFDNSSSMGESVEGNKLWDAKEGTIEFLRNCIPNRTSVAVHPMYSTFNDLTYLTTNLPALSLLVKSIPRGSNTPLFQTLSDAQTAEPKATRYIIFSDGAPDILDERNYKEPTISKAQEEKTPVDTILIWSGDQTYMKDSREYKLLQEIAELTGGIFLVFDRNKMDFKKGLKYLAPKLRLQLMNEQVRKDLEEGKLK